MEENDMNKVLNSSVRQLSRKVLFRGEIVERDEELEGGGFNQMGEL